MVKEKLRRQKNAPCGFESFNTVKQITETIYPPVNCSFKCEECGWNPEAANRRLRRMGYKKEEETQ